MKFKILLYAFIFVVFDSKMQVRAVNCSNIARENIVYTDGVIEIVPNVMLEKCDDEEEMNEDGHGESVKANLGSNYGITTSSQHPRVKRDQNSGDDSGERYRHHHRYYHDRDRHRSGERPLKLGRIGRIFNSDWVRTPLTLLSNFGSKRNEQPKPPAEMDRMTAGRSDGEYRSDENNGRNGYNYDRNYDNNRNNYNRRNGYDNGRNSYNDRNGNYDRNGYNNDGNDYNDRNHHNNDRNHQNDRSHQSNGHQNNDRSHQSNGHQNNDKSHQSNDRSHENNDRSHRNNDRRHQNNDRQNQNNDRSNQNNDRSHQNDDRNDYGRNHNNDRNDYNNDRNHHDNDRNDRDGEQPRLDQPKGEDSPFRQRPVIINGKRHMLHLKGGMDI